HDMAESRRCHTPGNRGLDDVLQWRIIEFIKNEQWSPRQISGRLKLEGINVSHEAIYALIRKDESGELASHCRH
ncbi:helix-turn-helix domain-containing protein, partial [Bacteroides gallinaceum]